jgi:hypothetical protein
MAGVGFGQAHQIFLAVRIVLEAPPRLAMIMRARAVAAADSAKVIAYGARRALRLGLDDFDRHPTVQPPVPYMPRR